MTTTRILDFGKNKGKVLADCEEKYLKWLVSHEKVLAKRNRWASRDAKFILDRKAQVVVTTTGNADWQEWNAALIGKPASKSNSNDVGLRGNLNGSREFSILR